MVQNNPRGLLKARLLILMGGVALLPSLLLEPPAASHAQVMGALGNSTGALQLPIGTTAVSRTSYGISSTNVIVQGGVPTVPSFTFTLPETPRATLPEQLLKTPRPFAPGLGPFELERP